VSAQCPPSNKPASRAAQTNSEGYHDFPAHANELERETADPSPRIFDDEVWFFLVQTPSTEGLTPLAKHQTVKACSRAIIPQLQSNPMLSLTFYCDNALLEPEGNFLAPKPATTKPPTRNGPFCQPPIQRNRIVSSRPAESVSQLPSPWAGLGRLPGAAIRISQPPYPAGGRCRSSRPYLRISQPPIRRGGITSRLNLPCSISQPSSGVFSTRSRRFTMSLVMGRSSGQVGVSNQTLTRNRG
jgi:hypothetical protein